MLIQWHLFEKALHLYVFVMSPHGPRHHRTVLGAKNLTVTSHTKLAQHARIDIRKSTTYDSALDFQQRSEIDLIEL